jgi:TetR/AcrR family transcriptional regulator, tetracycline repressor protein
VTTPAKEPRNPVDPDLVVETALRLVEEHDVSALTMRRLAAELGTAVTAIYWHVGNRDALLDLLVERLIADMGSVRLAGRSPRTRVSSVLTQWRARLLERPHLIAIAHERGRTAEMFQPLQAVLARELAAVGLHGEKAAIAIRALQFHVVASVVLQRTAGRGPTTNPTDPAAWPDMPDPELVRTLAAPLDYDQMFRFGLDALLDRLIPAPASRRRRTFS